MRYTISGWLVFEVRVEAKVEPEEWAGCDEVREEENGMKSELTLVVGNGRMRMRER